VPDLNVAGLTHNDYFQRVGIDGRFTYFDLDVYGTAFWGHDPFPGFLQDTITPAGPTDQFGFFVQADYMFKPWLMGFLRYEQVKIFNSGLVPFTQAADGTLISGGEQARIVPGVTVVIRQNLHVSSEVYIDTRGVDNPATGYPEANCQWITTLKWAF
jgi:hypothetical protein